MLQNEEKIHSNFWLLINIKIFNLLQSKNFPLRYAATPGTKFNSLLSYKKN